MLSIRLGPDSFGLPARVLNSPAFAALFAARASFLPRRPTLAATLFYWPVWMFGFSGSGLKCPCVLQPFVGSQPSPALQARDVFWFWLLRLPSCSPRLGPDFCDFPARVLNSPSFCSIFCCALLLFATVAHPGSYAFLLAGFYFGFSGLGS